MAPGQEPSRTIVGALMVLVSYAYFFWSLPLQASAFMINLGQLIPDLAGFFPYSIDSNTWLFPEQSMRIAVNVALLAVWAVPHSVLARQVVKSVLAPFIGEAYYRSFYVFQSSALLHLIIKYWQPMDGATVWDFSDDPRIPLAVYAFGWLWLVTATFALDHFDLFGLTSGFGIDFMARLGHSIPKNKMTERAHYTLCRHPIMFGFFVMFFGVPVMTFNHLVFSGACSVYILLAIKLFEEPDLVAEFGEDYRNYQQRVPMYCPFLGHGGASDAKEKKAR
jgi:protein-S-isoprenylcysteine O-methyltransferase Ste14